MQKKVRSTRDMTVYRLLVDSGLTQAQLADVLGVSPATVQASVRNARQEELPELNFSDTYQQGRWLRELRLRQSMTKQDLARNLGVPKSWVDDVESGDARLGDGRVPRAFDALGADVRRFQAYGWPDNA